MEKTFRHDQFRHVHAGSWHAELGQPCEVQHDISGITRGRGDGARVRPDTGQFWAGTAATAIVAALVALVGILICRWTLGIPILAPSSEGAWGNAHTGEYVVAVACAAVVAGALLWLLMLATPQPGLFFGWIIGLATLAAVAYPFNPRRALTGISREKA